MTDRAECTEARDLFPELAMDVAAGDERARALRHLSGCLACRRELAATSDAVDELLLLAPELEPPEGFEDSVMARLTAATGPVAGQEPGAARYRRLAVPLLWAASIVAVAVLAGGTVWSRTADDRNLASDYRHTLDVAHGHRLSAAPLLVAGGAETGTVFAYEGSPSWVYVTFRTAPQLGEYAVHLVTRDGRKLPLRPFTARPGGIAWGSIIPVSTKQIHTVEFSRSDATVMTARF